MPNFPSTTSTAGQSFHQTVSADRFAAPSAGSGDQFIEFVQKLRDVSGAILQKEVGRDSLAFSAALADLDKANTVIELYQFWQLARLTQ